MKKSRVASNALNIPKAGYAQLARLEPTAFESRSRRLQLTALEQLSKVLEAKQEIDPHTKKRTLPALVRHETVWPSLNASKKRHVQKQHITPFPTGRVSVCARSRQ